jgi:hypothetical protein
MYIHFMSLIASPIPPVIANPQHHDSQGHLNPDFTFASERCSTLPGVLQCELSTDSSMAGCKARGS